jgi:hypothetical protein
VGPVQSEVSKLLLERVGLPAEPVQGQARQPTPVLSKAASPVRTARQLMQLQRLAGNRAASGLVAVQRRRRHNGQALAPVQRCGHDCADRCTAPENDSGASAGPIMQRREAEPFADRCATWIDDALPQLLAGRTMHRSAPDEATTTAGDSAGATVVCRQTTVGESAPPMSPEEYDASAAALCVGDERRVGPPSQPFTAHQRGVVQATLWAARSLSAHAGQALSSHDPYMATLAARILHEPQPDLDELASMAVKIHDALANTPTVGGTCANPVCMPSGGGSPLADASEGHDLITICPFFFHPSFSLPEQRRTWLHEGGHIAGIDDPPMGAVYEHPPNCPVSTEGNCDDPCPSGDKNNVDTWARFLECVAFRY